MQPTMAPSFIPSVSPTIIPHSMLVSPTLSPSVSVTDLKCENDNHNFNFAIVAISFEYELQGDILNGEVTDYLVNITDVLMDRDNNTLISSGNCIISTFTQKIDIRRNGMAIINISMCTNCREEQIDISLSNDLYEIKTDPQIIAMMPDTIEVHVRC